MLKRSIAAAMLTVAAADVARTQTPQVDYQLQNLSLIHI